LKLEGRSLQNDPARKVPRRKSDPRTVEDVSDRLKEALSVKWPRSTVGQRIRRFAEEIGWSHTRAKDVYYADHRVSLRAFEQNELNTWFDDNGDVA
jgi:hypothetical protein